MKCTYKWVKHQKNHNVEKSWKKLYLEKSTQMSSQAVEARWDLSNQIHDFYTVIQLAEQLNNLEYSNYTKLMQNTVVIRYKWVSHVAVFSS